MKPGKRFNDNIMLIVETIEARDLKFGANISKKRCNSAL